MRIVLVGTDLAAVRPGAGALESLLAGWARELASAPHQGLEGTAAERVTGHEVTVVSVIPRGGGTVGDGRTVGGGGGGGGGGGAVASSPTPYRTVTVARPAGLRPLLDDLEPDVVILNNRPAWQDYVDAPTLHLFHNWPDAWAVPIGRTAADLVGRSGAAAVSRALAATVADALERPAGDIGIVAPFVDGELFAVEPQPQPGLILSPNRLMVKKGVRELAAIAGHPSMHGRRVLITDYLSPWITPTPEHEALRAIVNGSAARLIPPPPDRAGMAALYAAAEVVVCPSIGPEGLGLTALEAQAVGVPVVSSGLGGLREACLLPDLIADPRDAPAFAAAIARAAALDPGARGRLRETIRRRYSPATSLETLLSAVGRARTSGRRVGRPTTGRVGASDPRSGATAPPSAQEGTHPGNTPSPETVRPRAPTRPRRSG